MTVLGEYLRTPRPPWDYINHDCSRWLDRWLTVCGHNSAMVATDIVYNGERSALLTIARGGGLLALWARGMDAIGVNQVDVPSIGDAAILSIQTDDGTNETCGIWTGERWASVHKGGMVFGVGEPLMIWGL